MYIFIHRYNMQHMYHIVYTFVRIMIFRRSLDWTGVVLLRAQHILWTETRLPTQDIV